MRGVMRLAVLGLVAASLACCQSVPVATQTPAVGVTTSLAAPSLAAGIPLEEALRLRRSVRAFADTPLTEQELGLLLWAAQGITDERGYRTAPSAGALYPLEVYVATAEGVFHYQPDGHKLVGESRMDVREALYQAGLGQDAIRSAPSVFVIAAVYDRTARKYGVERGARYVHMEAGHAAQNLLLEAVALGLGAVPIGAFDDGEVQAACGLDPDQEPLYLIPVGRSP